MSDNLQEKAVEMRREYLREWRRKNPDAVRRHNNAYWQKKAAQQKEQQKEDQEGTSDAIH